MPSTLRPRAPRQKALSIGIEYGDLDERFPQSQLRLPAAHIDPVIMSGLLQGVSHGVDWHPQGDLDPTAVVASRAVWLSARGHYHPYRREGIQ